MRITTTTTSVSLAASSITPASVSVCLLSGTSSLMRATSVSLLQPDPLFMIQPNASQATPPPEEMYFETFYDTQSYVGSV